MLVTWLHNCIVDKRRLREAANPERWNGYPSPSYCLPSQDKTTFGEICFRISDPSPFQAAAMASTTVERVSGAQVATAAACVALVGLLAYETRLLRRKLRIARGLAPLDGPKGVPLLGVLPKYMENKDQIYDFLEGLLQQFGGRMKMPWHLFFDGAIYVTDPEDVKYILHTNFENFIKPPGFIDAFRELFGGSLFAMNHAHCPDNGDKWRLQRKVAVKVFTANNFKVFMEQSFDKYALQMAALIESQPDGQCDLQDIARQFTMRSMFDITVGIPMMQAVPSIKEFDESLDFVNEQSVARMFIKQQYQVLGWCMPSEYRLKREVAAIRSISGRIVGQRLQESDAELAKRSDILSLFIKKMRELSAEEASLLDTDTIQKLVHAFLFAGRDTTSCCITYTFYALCRNPEAHRKLVDEILNIYASKEKASNGSSTGSKQLTYEDIKSLRYLDAVVQETLRLYPPVPYNAKRAAVDDHLPDGTFVPAGCDLVYSPWYMGRNSAMWGPDPLVFRPERWLEMDEKKSRPSAYEHPVFQAGPRICIGMNMALLEAKMFIAIMLQRFDNIKIQPGAKQERGYILKSTLTMAGGLPLQMTPREAGKVA